jgi:hypothetical protein
MNKVAIFVEGDTELIFIAKLLEEVAGYGRIHLKLFTQHGSHFHFSGTRGPSDGVEYEIHLMNCRGDGGVKSFIQERMNNLISKGFSTILGLRDVYPSRITDIERFELGLAVGLETDKAHVKICLAVREVEAWFLNEDTHYKKIDEILTSGKIKNDCGFDPVIDLAQDIQSPYLLLQSIYRLGGFLYNKDQDSINRIVSALDMSHMYCSVRERSESLDKFLDELDLVFT